MDSTKNKVLDYLFQSDKGLTVTECREMFGTTELRAIVAHAAKKGWVFDKAWEYGINKYGKPTKWVRYTFVGYEVKA